MLTALRNLNFKPSHHKVRAVQYLSHLALIPAFIYGSWQWWVAALLVYYMFHGLGSACGAHRFWTHRSYQASVPAQWLMGLLFTLASSGSVIGYVLIHIRHHAYSDQEQDPHSPARMGLFKTWLGILDEGNLRVDPKRYFKLLKDPILAFYHNYYFLIIMLYVLLLLLIDPLAVVFLYAVPVVAQFHANSALIVLCHDARFGYRNFETTDVSRNLNPLWKVYLLGEELHNNHHYRPASDYLNLKNTIWEFDPLYYVIKYFLQSPSQTVKVPSEKMG